MKRNLRILGVFFLVVMAGMSVFFLLEYFLTKNKEISEPNIGSEPSIPNRMDMSIKGPTYEQKLDIYYHHLDAYTQNKIAEENRYQQALRDRDSSARSYLLYMVILDSVLAVLVFLSFFLASRIKEEATTPSVAGEVEGTTENTKD